MNTTTEQTGRLERVLLVNIAISTTNNVFRSKADMSAASLQELVDSIKKYDVLQPVLLRKNEGPGKILIAGSRTHQPYVLVAGHRRYDASKMAGLSSIPAFIRDMTEEEAFEMQLTENLQRKDIHPMTEARAYQMMQKERGWSVAEIAARFGRGETYILTRLRLNKLIKEAAEDFESGAMPLTHALIIAKLEPHDQALVVEKVKRHDTTMLVPGGKQVKYTFYEHANELQDYINRHILQDLKSAPFDLADEELVKAAGACHRCSKQSANAPLLFPELRESKKNFCLDTACFKLKTERALAIKVKEQIVSKPDTIFVIDSWAERNEGKVPKEIKDALQDAGIKPIQEDKLQSYAYGKFHKKIRATILNGDHAGEVVTRYAEGAAAGANGKTIDQVDAKEAVARIKERLKSSARLDGQKVYRVVLEQLEAIKDTSKEHQKAPIEYNAIMRALLFSSADRQVEQKLERRLKLSQADEKRAKQFREMDQPNVAAMIRLLALSKFKSEFFHDGAEGILMVQLAEAAGIDVKGIRKAQEEAAAKREANAKKRIDALQAPKDKARKATKGKKTSK